MSSSNKLLASWFEVCAGRFGTVPPLRYMSALKDVLVLGPGVGVFARVLLRSASRELRESLLMAWSLLGLG